MLPLHNNPALGSKGQASAQHKHQSVFFRLVRTITTVFTSVGSVSLKGDASDEDDDNEFFDAMQDPAEFITVPADPKYHRLVIIIITALFPKLFCFSDFSQKRLLSVVFIPPPGDQAAMSVVSAVRLELMISR